MNFFSSRITLFREFLLPLMKYHILINVTYALLFRYIWFAFFWFSYSLPHFSLYIMWVYLCLRIKTKMNTGMCGNRMKFKECWRDTFHLNPPKNMEDLFSEYLFLFWFIKIRFGNRKRRVILQLLQLLFLEGKSALSS